MQLSRKSEPIIKYIKKKLRKNLLRYQNRFYLFSASFVHPVSYPYSLKEVCFVFLHFEITSSSNTAVVLLREVLPSGKPDVPGTIKVCLPIADYIQNGCARYHPVRCSAFFGGPSRALSRFPGSQFSTGFSLLAQSGMQWFFKSCSLPTVTGSLRHFT